MTAPTPSQMSPKPMATMPRITGSRLFDGCWNCCSTTDRAGTGAVPPKR